MCIVLDSVKQIVLQVIAWSGADLTTCSHVHLNRYWSEDCKINNDHNAQQNT